MTHSFLRDSESPAWRAWGLVCLGVVLLGIGWNFPVSIHALHPLSLEEAGQGTPDVERSARESLERGWPGPAALMLQCARDLSLPFDEALVDSVHHAGLETGGLGFRHVGLGEILSGAVPQDEKASIPALTATLPEGSRRRLREPLKASSNSVVQALLATAGATHTSEFVPVDQPGGQPLDAVILIAAQLAQDGFLQEPFAQALVQGAAEAAQSGNLRPLEEVYMDWLILGRRLDWGQLAALARTLDGADTLHAATYQARAEADSFPMVYTAVLMTGKGRPVLDYLGRYGEAGRDALAHAVGHGRGAVQLLVERQRPLMISVPRAPAFLTAFCLVHPSVAWALKAVCLLLGAFFAIGGFNQLLADPERAGEGGVAVLTGPRGLALALIVFAGLVIVGEPYLLLPDAKAGGAPTYVIPSLDPSAATPQPEKDMSSALNDTSTLLSIGVFLALQILVYSICLMKIREIDQAASSALIKLRLMENEENLFDSGLYVGIAGTAAALVLQVLGVIQANLLAAYSSNLFGIVCVALVKIRNVRPYKRKLILACETAGTVPTPATAAGSVSS